MTERIDGKEFFSTVYIYILANDLIRGIYAKDLKQNVWISVFLGVIGSLLLFSGYMLIYKNQNYANFTEAVENILGKFLSKFLFIFYAIYFMVIAYMHNYFYFELVNGYLLNHTPMFILVITCLYVNFYVVRHGIEVIGRLFITIFICLVFFYILSYALLIIVNDVKLENFLPILEYGITPIIKPAFQMSYAVPFGEIFVLFIIFQYVKNKRKKIKTALFGIAFAGLALLMLSFLNITLLGHEIMAAELSPSIGLSHLIDFGNIVQRYDIIVVGVFALHSFAKVTILIYAAKHLINSAFPGKKETVSRKKDAITIAIICLIIAAAGIFTTFNYFKFLLFKMNFIVPYINLTFELIIPLILIVLSFIRKPKNQLTSPDFTI